MSTSTAAPIEQALRACVGQELDADRRGRDAVNVAMIRNWCDALGDTNPVYLDAGAAVHHGFDGIVAPPAMLRTWTMLAPPEQLTAAEAGPTTVYHLLKQAGFTAMAGTNCNHNLLRYLVPGDELVASTRLLAVSAEKRTALGSGFFIDTGTTYRDAAGTVVAEMMWRSLRYRPAPPDRPAPKDRPAPPDRTRPPRPSAAPDPAGPLTTGRRAVAGQRLPSAQLAITPSLIIGGAMASRDYQRVHHDRDYARTQGMPDIFMNMMTTAGLVSRYVTDWAGPAARIHTLNLTLGVPNHPGDTMRLDADVQGVRPLPGGDRPGELVDLVVAGRNSLGRHVRADVGLSVPAGVSG